MNNIKTKYKILIGIILIVLGYTVGQFLPFQYLRPNVKSSEITLNDLYTRFITTIGTCATLSAVLVALFKEDIRKNWEKANLEVTFRDNNALHEVLDDEASSSNYKAKKYETALSIKNNGNLSARNCEVILERLQFKTNITPYREINVTGHPLSWNNNSNSILIPSTGKAIVTIIEIISPESQSVPAQSRNTLLSPKIKIGNLDPLTPESEGKWLAHFKVYSENAKPIDYILAITWNSKWEHRITEMKKCVAINLENPTVKK